MPAYVSLFFVTAFIYAEARLANNKSIFSAFIIGLIILGIDHLFFISPNLVQVYGIFGHTLKIVGYLFILAGLKNVQEMSNLISFRQKMLAFLFVFFNLFYLILASTISLLFNISFPEYFPHMLIDFILIAGLVKYISASRLIQPISNISNFMDKHELGEKPEKIPVISNDEMGVLTEKINKILNLKWENSQKLRHARDREALLRKITESIRSSLDINDLKRTIVSEIGKAFEAEKCGIFEYDSKSRKFLTLDENSQYLVSNDIANYTGINLEEEELKPFRDLYLSGKDLIDPDIDNPSENTHPLMSKFYKQAGIKSNYTLQIIYHGELLGILYLNYLKQKRVFSKDELIFLKELSIQAGTALYQAKIYNLAKKQAEREALLRKIIETVRNTFDIDKIKQNVVELVGKAFNTDKCFFWDYDVLNKEFIHELKFDYVSSPEFKKPYTYGKPTDDWLIETYRKQGYIYVEDFSELAKESGHMCIIGKHQVEYHGIGTNCCFGIFDEDQFMGAFAVQYKDVTPLGKEDIELLTTIVNQISIALRQAASYSQIKKQAEIEALLRKIIQTVNESLDLNLVLNTICKEIFELFKPDRVSIENYPDPNNLSEWEVTSQWTSSPDILGVNDIEYSSISKQYLGARVVNEGKDIIADDIEKSDLPDYYIDTHKKMNIKSYIAIPLGNWGTLALSQVHNYRHWTQEEIQLLHTIANQADIAIKQADLYSQTKKQAEIEALLRKIIEAVDESIDLNLVLNTICTEVLELFKPDRVSIANYPDLDDLSKWAVTKQWTSGQDILGINDIEYSSISKQYLGARVVKQGKDIIADNIEKSDLPDYFIDTNKKMNIKSYIAVPIGKWGALLLSQVHNYRHWTEKEIQLLHTIANQADIAIKQADLYSNIKSLNEDLEHKVIERTEQLESVNKELESFAYTVSHDLRAPLRGMNGYSLALLEDYDDKLDTQGKEYLQQIRTNSEKMGQLINEILELSRLSRSEMHIKPINLSTVVQEIIDVVKTQDETRNIEFKIEDDIETKGDPALIKVVLQNLIENAWKFTMNSPAAVVEFGVTKLEDDQKAFFVKDNGAGFDMRHVDKLFMPFQRLHQAHEYPGTGIGLATVQRIIHSHGGKIWAESAVGKGSVFYFVI